MIESYLRMILSVLNNAILRFIVFFTVSLFCAVQITYASQIHHTKQVTSDVKDDKSANSAPNNRYIVQLKQKALSAYLLNTKMSSNSQSKNTAPLKHNLSSTKAAAYKNQLISEQHAFTKKLNKTSTTITIHHHYQSLLNGFSLSASDKDIELLRNMPEVKTIYADKMRYVHLDSSHELIGSASAWESAGGQSEAGKGIKIAIIDTGIRNDNPMFFDDGFSSPDLSGNAHLAENPDYCRAVNGDPDFCNNKIIVARWIDPTGHIIFNLDPNEYMSPLGLNRHGSHVAGIAAGNPVDIEFEGVPVTLSGVAPGSYLMIYKALYSSQGSTFGSDSMLLEALEYAVKDGADVINNSWGSYAGESPEESVYSEVFANAEALGISIVGSAGNTGGIDQGSINCPGCIESGITVANTMHGRFFGHKVTIDQQSFVAVQGEVNQLSENLNLILHSYSEIGGNFSGACEYPFANPTFENALVLVDYRGNCGLETIANNVQLAGGKVALIYQSGVSDSQSRGPFIPYSLEYAIPVLGVSRASGLTLFDKADRGSLTASIEANTSRIIEPQFSDVMNNSSSAGPNTNPNVLKPDLAAPGTNILSASAPAVVAGPGPFDPFDPFPPTVPSDDAPVFTMISGTSMSSPHVAGAVALLKQAHSDWSPQQIKSALTSTANNQIQSHGINASPFSVGAGRIQLDMAMNAKLTFDQVSYANSACIGRCYFENTLQNQAESEENWEVSVTLDHPMASALFTSNSSITLAGKGNTGDSINLVVEIDTSQVESGVWVFGNVKFSHAAYQEQHLPIAIYANDNSDKTVLSTSADVTDSGSDITINSKVRNFNFSDEPALKISLPDNVTFVQNSETAEVSRGQTDLLEYDQQSNTLLWHGSLAPGSMQLVPDSPWGNTSLASLDIAPVACGDNCFNFGVIVDFEYSYDGKHYSHLALSSNGFAKPGDEAVNSFLMSNYQRFPQQDELNNIIAPLWAEYDFKGGNNSNAAGYLRTTIRTIEGVSFLIAEWDSVNLFGFNDDDEQSQTYSFQLIIEENTDNIWFNYLSIPQMPARAAVGAENLEALVGVSYYFNGEGTSLPTPTPQSGYTLKLVTEDTGEANIQFKLRLADKQNSTTMDVVAIDEDSTEQVDVLANDTGALDFTISAQLTAGNTYQTSRLVKVSDQGELDPTSLEITQQADYGNASIIDGKLQYQPDQDYAGNDEIAYRVADIYGHYSKTTPVLININTINDAPQVSLKDKYIVNIGDTVTLSAQASDIDSATLTYHWQQTAGIILPFEQTDNQLTFTAPQRDGGPISFTVTVNDGELSSSASTTISINKRRSGGTLWSLNLMILIVFIYYRRRGVLT